MKRYFGLKYCQKSIFYFTALMIIAGAGSAAAQTALESKKTAPTSLKSTQEPAGARPLSTKMQNTIQADTSSESFTIEVGPVWSTTHAQQVCPARCAEQSANWTNSWWTTQQGVMSVCQCKR